MPVVNLGLDNHFYLSTGTHGSPVWVLQTHVKDLSKSWTKTESPANFRGSNFDMQLEGLIKTPVKFSLLRGVDPTSYAIFQSGFLSRGTVLDVAVADGPIATSGTIYWRADYNCFGFDEKEDLEDPVMADVSLNLAISVNAQGITTVSGS